MEYQDRKIRLDVFSFASMTEDKITEWMNSVFGTESLNGGELPELPYGYLFTSTESNEDGKYLKFGVYATFHKIRNHYIVPHYRITRGEEVTYEEYLSINGVDYSLHEYTESPMSLVLMSSLRKLLSRMDITSTTNTDTRPRWIPK